MNPRTHRSFNRIWKERDSAEPDILSRILDKDNLNRAYKRVKANKGAPGIDGMTIEAVLPWLRDNHKELVERIQRGKYTPSPVKRVEIPKPDGGTRKYIDLEHGRKEKYQYPSAVFSLRMKGRFICRSPDSDCRTVFF